MRPSEGALRGQGLPPRRAPRPCPSSEKSVPPFPPPPGAPRTPFFPPHSNRNRIEPGGTWVDRGALSTGRKLLFSARGLFFVGAGVGGRGRIRAMLVSRERRAIVQRTLRAEQLHSACHRLSVPLVPRIAPFPDHHPKIPPKKGSIAHAIEPFSCGQENVCSCTKSLIYWILYNFDLQSHCWVDKCMFVW